MKFFGHSKVTRLVETYHPHFSALLLLAIGASKYTGHEEIFRRFTDLSYADTMQKGDTTHEHYRKGWDDALFVFFCFQVVTVFRYLYCNLILKSLWPKRLSKNKGLTLKFIDVGWFSLFFLTTTALGIYLFCDDEWWYSSPHFWKGYPHPFDYEMKFYYLASLAFWLQCLFSFFFESPRKDDGAFFFHHLLTIGLLLASYHFNYFRVGAAILLEQNATDVFYYHAKMFKYMEWERTSTSILVMFLFVWIYTRHFIFGWILYSLWAELPQYISVTAWDSAAGYYYSDSLWFFFALALVALQGLMIYWFYLIMRVVYRVVLGGDGSDPTDGSDDEEEVKNGADEPNKKSNHKQVEGEHKKANGKMNGKANGAAHKSDTKKAK